MSSDGTNRFVATLWPSDTHNGGSAGKVRARSRLRDHSRMHQDPR